MRDRVPAGVKAGQHLQRVETLLDQVLDDLTGNRVSPPCSRSSELLADVFAELQTFSRLLAESNANQADFQSRLKALFPQMKRAERLLSSAAQFYSGWCAAGLQSAHSASGYQSEHISPGPALLAWEG